MFVKNYDTILNGSEMWQKLEAPTGTLYSWDEKSTYIHKPPFDQSISSELSSVKNMTKTVFWSSLDTRIPQIVSLQLVDKSNIRVLLKRTSIHIKSEE